MGNCCPCFGSSDDGTHLYNASGQSGGGGQRLGTRAEYQEEVNRRAKERAAARAAVEEEPRRVDPNLTDVDRQTQRELRIQAAEKRTQTKKPKASAANREFRNPNNDPNALQWSV